MYGIHVDDIFGCALPKNHQAELFQKTLKETFTFREWLTGNHLQFCGCEVNRAADGHWELVNTKYLSKLKPISISKERLNQPNLDVTDSERSQLRSLVGGLQWPATQTSPHIQAMVSTLAGQICSAKVSTLLEANKVLRFAKNHGDAGLQYRDLGPVGEITLACCSDASFASRPTWEVRVGTSW